MDARIEQSQLRVVAGRGARVDLLVTLSAPEPTGVEARRPVRILPVVDVSGSMEGTKIEAVRKALGRLITHLHRDDQVGLVAFDHAVRSVVVPRPLGEVRDPLLFAVRSLRCGGETNLGAAIELALELGRAAETRVVVLTDGRANRGRDTTPGALRDLVAARATSCSLSAFGFGEDCDHVLLGGLAEEGGGAYAYLPSDEAVLVAFARELGALLTTYATGIEITLEDPAGRVLDRAVVPDVLAGQERQVLLELRAPTLELGEQVAGHVVVGWTMASGAHATRVLTVALEGVHSGAEDRLLPAAIVRVLDERVFLAALSEAEGLAGAGALSAARDVVRRAVSALRDADLIRLAIDHVLPGYASAHAHHTSSGLRASTMVSLGGRSEYTGVHSRDRLLRRKQTTSQVHLMQSFLRPDPSDPAKR